jgi:hypothetical protein
MSNRFPPGWDEARVERILEHYERQSEEEAVAEDEALMAEDIPTVMNVPKSLLEKVRRLIAENPPRSEAG